MARRIRRDHAIANGVEGHPYQFIALGEVSFEGFSASDVLDSPEHANGHTGLEFSGTGKASPDGSPRRRHDL